MRGPDINYGPQVNGISTSWTRDVSGARLLLLLFFRTQEKRKDAEEERSALEEEGEKGGEEAAELMGRGRQRASGVLRQYRAGPAARTVSDYYDECSQDSHISIFGPEFCVLNDRNHDNAVSHTAPGNAHTPASTL